MATVTKPIALDESINTTESPSRNVADVLAQELSGIASAITGGSDKVPKTDVATVEPSTTASRSYSVGELVYVNGNLYKVIASISMGSSFTVGTNIQATNISQIIDSLSAVGVGGVIDLHGYTSGTPYVTEHDGFAYIAPQVNNEFLWIKGFSAMGGLASQLNTTFVKKGMELYTNAGSSSTVRFTEIV